MRYLATLLFSALFFPACQAPVDEGYGEFSFNHNPTEEEYVVDVLYEGESVGTITKEVPADAYDVYLMEIAGDKAFIAVDPTGLGGYILYGHAFDVYVYDFSNQTFSELAVDSVDDISPDGNQVAYWRTWEGTDGAVSWGIAVYDISKGMDIGGYVVNKNVFPYDEGGNATFSPSGRNLAFELGSKGEEEGDEEHALFVGNIEIGNYVKKDSQVNEYFSMDWETNETLISFEDWY